MADEKAFSHITVSTDDEDDVVIQAGARTTPRPAAPKPAIEAGAAEAPSRDSSAAPAPPADGDAYSGQRLEDLSGTPMPTVQKAVLILALLLIVASVVYYFFFLR